MSKIHLIGNAHLDPVWLWRWQEGFAEITATFRSALDRMKDFPDFKFTSACSVYYEWIEKLDKEMFEEIRQRVQEGRWNIVGGWFLQPDCNTPCGESFARHGLVAQRYFKDKFGVTVKTGYNVDSFGHNAMLPQILKKSGMDHYVYMRPAPYEKEQEEDLFLWESADGSQVCTYRIPWFYNYDLSRLDCFPKIKEKAEENGIDYMAFYGVGNHGGGPTIKLMDEISKLGIPDMIYSTPDEYFAEIDQRKLTVVADELQHHARGCYSASAYVKRNNRKCENNLLAAEKFCSMARYLVGAEYPKKKLKKAWKNVLFNQFHDILGGCCIQKAYEDAGYLYGETMSITEQAINFAMQAIAHKIDTLQGEQLPSYKSHINWKIWEHEVLGTPVVVFNPYEWTVRMPIQFNAVAKKMTDDKGQEIPYQIVRGDQTNGSQDKYHTTFLAEVPPMGYVVYRFFTEKETERNFERTLSVTEHSLENDRIRVEFSRETGDICRIYDKRKEKTLLDGVCRAVLLDETDCDTWAHDKVYLGEQVGSFGQPEFRIIEEGDVRVTLRTTCRYQDSVLVREYTLVSGDDRVSVRAKVDFHEKHKVLKLAFPLTDEEVIAQIPYGTISRKKGLGEEPCGSWLAAGAWGIANDGKHGYDTTEDEVRLTVLRSAIYADHYGVRDDFCEYMEQGVQEFDYVVFPYESKSAAERMAAELNFGLRAVMDSFHAGVLEEQHSCMKGSLDNVIITAVKQAEDGEDTVVRFYEIDGREAEIDIEILGKRIVTSVAHHEIKTFCGEAETNLIEW